MPNLSSSIRRAIAVTALVGVCAGCSSASTSSTSSSSGSSAPAGTSSAAAPSGGAVVIGASLPLTGPGAQPALKAGYEQAVTTQNAKGGVTIGGKSYTISLTIDDNGGDATKMVQQLRQLVQEQKAIALLGPCCDLDIQAAAVANGLKIPMVQTTLPTEIAAQTQKGEYSWTVFQNAADQADQYFRAGGLASLANLPNKKIALIASNDASGQLWTSVNVAAAKANGWDVTVEDAVPTGTTDFSSFISAARSAGAEAVRANMIAPDGIALWKQMKSLHFQPRIADCTLCDGEAAWGTALGELADGAMAPMWWTPTSGLPDAQTLLKAFEGEYPNIGDAQQAVATYNAAQVLFDALGRSGSTGPDDINTAIGKTDSTFALGPVKFTTGNVATTPSFWGQWQNGKIVEVYPNTSTKAVFPIAGLG